MCYKCDVCSFGANAAHSNQTFWCLSIDRLVIGFLYDLFPGLNPEVVWTVPPRGILSPCLYRFLFALSLAFRTGFGKLFFSFTVEHTKDDDVLAVGDDWKQQSRLVKRGQVYIEKKRTEKLLTSLCARVVREWKKTSARRDKHTNLTCLKLPFQQSMCGIDVLPPRGTT